MKDEEFIDYYLKVLGYFRPRMQYHKNEEVESTGIEIKLTFSQIDKLVEKL